MTTDAEIVQLKRNMRVSREDWIAVATDVLVSQGVDQVKILNLSDRLQVSRSSFYWHFKSRAALLDALLESWDAVNTKSLVDACNARAETITAAVCHLFRCFIDQDLFDPKLDFAVRDWSRRSGAVRRVLDRADGARLDAIRAMFERFGYPSEEAGMRARILYYMQLGYYSLELSEPLEERLALTAGYLSCFTGREPPPGELDQFIADVRAIARRD